MFLLSNSPTAFWMSPKSYRSVWKRNENEALENNLSYFHLRVSLFVYAEVGNM